MKRLLPSLALLPAAPALAQPAPADTARAYWHTLGLTASPQLAHFFTANRALPLGLLYKRQLRPGRALRARVVGYYSNRDTSNFLLRRPTATFLGFVDGPNILTR